MRTDREECRYRIVAPSCNQFIWLSLNCLLANSFHLKDMMLFQRWGMRLWFNWHFVSQGVAIVKRSKSMNLVSQSCLFDHWQCCRWFLAGRDRQSCLGQSLGREENRGREPVSSCCVFLPLLCVNIPVSQSLSHLSRGYWWSDLCFRLRWKGAEIIGSIWPCIAGTVILGTSTIRPCSCNKMQTSSLAAKAGLLQFFSFLSLASLFVSDEGLLYTWRILSYAF